MKSIIFVLAILVLVVNPAFAADYYVATNGNDSDPGTLAQPFATVQYAVNLAAPGDTIYLRAGNYHEEVDLTSINGAAGQEITITNYNGEVATMDGTIPITGSWTQHSGNIYKLTIPEDVWQLWVDGEMMTLARFPNALAWSDEMWDRDTGYRYMAMPITASTLIDNPAKGHPDTLAAAGVSFEGCIAVMNARNWETYARVITNHTAGSNTFDYDPPINQIANNEKHTWSIEGGLACLDIAQEWSYDKDSKTLYLYADDGQDPTGRDIRGKNKTHAFSTAGDNASYINIDGINFYGTSFDMSYSDHCTVQNAELLYPTFSDRATGGTHNPPEGHKSMQGYSNATLAWASKYLTLFNCSFSYLDEALLMARGSEHITIDNCSWTQADYAALGYGYGIVMADNDYITYRNNTLDTVGDSVGTYNSQKLVEEDYPLFENNLHMRQGLLQTDGSSMQNNKGAAATLTARYNWFIDNERYSFRFDGNPAGQFGNVYRNVAMNPDQSQPTAFRLKGDYHEILNNTAVDDYSVINVATDKGGNLNSVAFNNSADIINPWPIPAVNSNNFAAKLNFTRMRDLLRDPDNYDFRPRASASQLIDQGITYTTNEGVDVTASYNGSAPDIGAYEYGDTNYWIPGQKKAGASMPVPPNGADGVQQDADLMWRTGLYATSYDVYFGTTPGSLVFQDNQSNNIFSPGALAADSIYYWRVDAITPSGTVVGDEWMLDTTPAAGAGNPTATLTDDAMTNTGNITKNFGSETKSELQHTKRRIYLKFLVENAETITNATLRVKAVDAMFDMTAYEVTGTDWAENSLTAENDTNVWGNALDTVAPVLVDEWYEFDVTSWITGNGYFTLGLRTTDSRKKIYMKESGTGPELILQGTGGGPTNMPPFFNAESISKPAATEGVAYSESLANDATDLDGDPLTFSKLAGPDWLTVAADGTLSGTPGVGDSGSFTVVVEDGQGGSDDVALNITVNAQSAPNGPPVFDSDPVIKLGAVKNVFYHTSLIYDAEDAEGDAFVFEKVSGPDWLTIEADGDISGMPLAEHVGDNNFVVKLTDENGFSSEGAVIVRVYETRPNNSPVFTIVPFTEATATASVYYIRTIASKAFDPDGDPITFSKVSGPAWLGVAASGTIWGTPSNADSGLNTFVVRVDDNNFAFNESPMKITVNANVGPDVSGEGVVNVDDFALIAERWLDDCVSPDWCKGTDLDKSGAVGITDIRIFAESWLQ